MENDKKIVKVIGVGASAGGLGALKDLLQKLPIRDDIAYVVIQHQKPTHKSLLPQLLSKTTILNVKEAKDGEMVKDGVYIAPPGSNITIEDGVFHLEDGDSGWMPTPSVDKFFLSIAQSYGENGWGVVLSGTGSDGAHGIRAIKAECGIVFAQHPKSAEYDGMPRSAIETGSVDFVLSPNEIGLEIEHILNHPQEKRRVVEEKDAYFRVLNAILLATKCDFTDYKRATVERRIERRMVATRIDSLLNYAAFVESNSDEAKLLFKDMLIGVTAFYREPEAFLSLSKFASKAIEKKSDGDDFRVWIAGCSSGEEAYSIAIMLNELLNSSKKMINIQIFATDLDEESITFARKGVFSCVALANLDKDLQDRYFRPKNGQMEIVKTLRENIIFSHHNMIKDPPFVKTDLVCCRNVLIYFNNELQKQILGIFHYSLKEGGILFLGKSEAISNSEGLYSTLDSHSKIFKRLIGSSKLSLNFVPKAFKLQNKPIEDLQNNSIKKRTKTFEDLVSRTLFENTLDPLVVINDKQEILYAKGTLYPYINIPTGEMSSNIFKMANESIKVELRALIHKAQKDSAKHQVAISGDKKSDFPKTTITLYPNEEESTFLIIFSKEPEAPLIISGENRGEQVAHLEQELYATREYLQTVIEELETSNEEMQSLNEEMQASNEELQASNEELETSNEELQATNEELQSAYAELKMLYQERESQRRNLENSQNSLKEKNRDLEETKNELLKHERILEAVYGKAGVGICVNDSNDKIIKANSEFCNLFDYKIEELLGKQFFTILPQSQKESSFSIYNRYINNEIKAPIEWRIERRCGKVVYVLFTAQMIVDENSEYYKIITITDITERKEREERLKLVAKVFENTQESIIITDANQKIVDVNNAATKITGFTKEELISQSTNMLSSKWHDKKFYEEMFDALKDRGYWRGEIRDRKKNGELYEALLSIIAVYNEKSELVNYIAIQNEITEQKEQEERIKHLAYYDMLTDLPNRTLFLDRVSTAIERAKRDKKRIGVLFLDLDRFKIVNDSYGHHIGDLLLKEVGAIIKESLRKEDTVSRLGGDEFVIMLENLKSSMDAIELIERIRVRLLDAIVVDGIELYTSISVGISIYPDDGEDVHTLLKNADAAMYEIKNEDKNGYRFFKSDMNTKASRVLALESGLRKAIENNSFTLMFQPQVDIVNSRIIGIEALLRFTHENLGPIPPDEFIKLAEDNGMIIKIGDWVIKNALKEFSLMQRSGIEGVKIAINISAKQLRVATLLDDVLKYAKEFEVDIGKIELEVTESALMGDIERAILILKEIKKAGIEIAIDDFGTGYSSLSYLKKLPLDRLKIDRAFVKDLLVDNDDRVIVDLVIAMAQNLGLKVIAEGAEDREIVEYLKDRGCEEIQGYYFSKPLSRDEFISWYREFDGFNARGV